jgi:RNA polymerase sigma-70 factor (ECF subfamily)
LRQESSGGLAWPPLFLYASFNLFTTRVQTEGNVVIPTTQPALLRDLRSKERREDAWAAFHDSYQQVIFDWCHGRLDYHSAEDLTQEILLKLFRALPAHEHDPARGRFRCWLKTVVANALRDHVRRRHAHPEPQGKGGTSVFDLQETGPDVDDLSHVIESQAKSIEAETLRRIQNKVSRTTWQAFWLTAIEQRSAKEVAELVGIKPGSVFKAKYRINQMIKKEYENAITSK